MIGDYENTANIFGHKPGFTLLTQDNPDLAAIEKERLHRVHQILSISP